MKFSERLGYKLVKETLQIQSIDDDLRNSLWSIFVEECFKYLGNTQWENLTLPRFTKSLWFNFFKLPLDSAPIYSDGSVSREKILEIIRTFFFKKGNWYDPYDIIQFSIDYGTNEYIKTLNQVLEREKSGYRFINKQLVPITSAAEILAIENVLEDAKNINSVNTHFTTALKLLADKHNPDYRNSIKESISAIEAACKNFTNDEKATLGDALTQMEKQNLIHPSLKKGISALYGYASDDGGIRHALKTSSREPDFHEAKFVLVTCSAIASYLLARISTAGS